VTQSAEPNPEGDADRLDAAADQAIAACGGNGRDAAGRRRLCAG
jgi:hypothetical protein